MMNERKPFQALDFPLTGRRLIEASAGTGKTYNIANLYLRLLIGDGTPAKTVDQILVVTFTRAATDELRGRIREKVAQALQAFRGEDCDDAVITSLKLKYKDPQATANIIRVLNRALVCMDEACIFTIHGFAVRAIKAFLFETGALADVELSEGENVRRDLVLADLWRQLKLSKHPALSVYVAEAGFEKRDTFMKYFSKAGPLTVIPDIQLPATASIEEALPAIEACINQKLQPVRAARKTLAAEWKRLGDEVGVDALKAAYGDKGNSSCVTQVSQILASAELQVDYGAKAKWYERLVERAESASTDTRIRDFTRRFLDHLASGISESALQKMYFRALLLQYIIHRSADIDLASMQLDEVITLINRTLDGDSHKATRLRNIITSSFPVCMVDEFQDTDPAQFSLFNKLYGDHPETGFFMIGDPKQSIYQFRGADIFSYLQVKQEVQAGAGAEQRVYPLNTNFRSKKELVDATNVLFCEPPSADSDDSAGTFFYEGIRYDAVRSCEEEPYRMDKGGLFDAALEPKRATPLVFIGNHDAAVAKKNLLWKYAKDTAQRIAALLDGNTLIQTEKDRKENKPPRALRGSDIAVLVRTGREAHAVRHALLAQQPRIGSVYQSQKDSVFGSSVIAEDLYHILCAMDDPKDKALLKKAMATLFYRGFDADFKALDELDDSGASGERAFESRVNEFEAYRDEWEHHGVLSALYAFVREHHLLDKLATLPDCDRLVTDFRHLGEILQSHEQQCQSREELIIWYARQLMDDSEMEEDSKRIRLESDENLVKIVTIHVSKGLEYPLVFLPFFYLPWQADAAKSLPMYHDKTRAYQAVVDYSMPHAEMGANMQREMQAEDMRLLYVAITRAMYQCYIGIADATHYGSSLFHRTSWAHLLRLTEAGAVSWPVIQSALARKYAACPHLLEYRELFDSSQQATDREHAQTTSSSPAMPLPLVSDVSLPALEASRWVITSYSRLAHTAKASGARRGGSDEYGLLANRGDTADPIVQEPVSTDIRYRLRGSNRTGDCLHELFEGLALDPARWLGEGSDYDEWLKACLRKHGLEKPEEVTVWPAVAAEQEKLLIKRRREVKQWLDEALDQPLLAGDAASSLRHILLGKQTLPEMAFDFSLGSHQPASINRDINQALRDVIGIDGIHVPYKNELEGLMTGSIDLFFVYQDRVYVLDYKSNTLGKSPASYSEQHMAQAMRDNRFDLQAHIYSVAAHRYMKQRLQDAYGFEQGRYRFGGVIYLFLRGMGLKADEYRRHGVYVHRPACEHVEALDSAFAGRALR